MFHLFIMVGILMIHHTIARHCQCTWSVYQYDHDIHVSKLADQYYVLDLHLHDLAIV